jgi:hypothetical protein
MTELEGNVIPHLSISPTPTAEDVRPSVPGCLDPTELLIMSTTISGSGEDAAGFVNIES